MNKPIKVSVICLTYNHINFIEDAIKGFLKQKTLFPFEIIIHDDKSTDGTDCIVRKYEKKYPNLIKGIYQNENQYSQGKNIIMDIVFPHVKGKYIALCEGDDFWIDEYKLQKQFSFMEKNKNYSLCSHEVHIVNKDKKILNKPQCKLVPIKNRLITSEQIILAGGGLLATASLFFPAKLIKEMPDFYYSCSVGDYPLIIWLSLKGKVYNFSQRMGCYRTGHAGSWSTNNMNDIQRIEKHFKNINKMLLSLDNYTNQIYHSCIIRRIRQNEISVDVKKHCYNKIKQKKYQDAFMNLPIKTKIHLNICCYFPWLEKIYQKMKKRMR